MSKSKEKCTKVKNPCKFCLQTVNNKTGLQCMGACKKWAHFKCLNYTPGKISDIKAGIIKVTCPCPDCETAQPKEFLTNPPFTCTNNRCPANISPKCQTKECPLNTKAASTRSRSKSSKEDVKVKRSRSKNSKEDVKIKKSRSKTSTCSNPNCANEGISCQSKTCPNSPKRSHPRLAPPRPPTPPRSPTRDQSPKSKSVYTEGKSKSSSKIDCPLPECPSEAKKKGKDKDKKTSSSQKNKKDKKDKNDKKNKKDSKSKNIPRDNNCSLEDCGLLDLKKKKKPTKKKSPVKLSRSSSLLSSNSSGRSTSGTPSPSSSVLASPKQRASLVKALQEMCTTVGKLSVQLKELMCKMIQ